MHPLDYDIFKKISNNTTTYIQHTATCLLSTGTCIFQATTWYQNQTPSLIIISSCYQNQTMYLKNQTTYIDNNTTYIKIKKNACRKIFKIDIS